MAVVGFDDGGETQVVRRVFVAEIDARFVGERAELLHERLEHHGGRAFEEPPATGSEERVAGEDGAVTDVRKRTERVSGNRETAKREAHGFDRLAVVDEAVLRRDAAAIVSAPEHVDAGETAHELNVTADVVGVVVRREDRAEAETELAERALDGLRLAGVHDRARRRAFRAHEVGVVVFETGNDGDLHARRGYPGSRRVPFGGIVARMAMRRLGRREALYAAGGAFVVAGLGLWFWPTSKSQAAYPFVRRLAGAQNPLWRIAPDKLAEATLDDAGRLAEYAERLGKAVARVETESALLGTEVVDRLGAGERKTIRELWWQVFEPILAIDAMKHRYDGWYGLDYVEHPLLHARGYALGFSALCTQVDCGLRLLRAMSGRVLAAKLWNEAMPELGLPSRTFDALRARLGRARDLFYVPVGAEWFDTWMRRHLAADTKLSRFLAFADAVRGRALRRVLTPTTAGVTNKVDLVKGELFQQWFPLQKGVAEWMGDTRLAKDGRRLVSDAQLHDFRKKLAPGDIILERRNWYVSNVGLPGFWPHAALYAGTQHEITEALARDPDVVSAYGDLGAALAKRHPKAWASLAERDDSGHDHVIVEAVSEGVVSASIEHSCGADYVAALRPRVPPLARAHAIERALSFWGRPYDFNFDFATDDEVVCSELVLKAFEPLEGDGKGLEVPFIEVAGRRAVPPTEFVRVFANELEKPDARFDFVHFLDGREKEHRAVVADAKALAASATRPKWDIVQP